MKSIYEKLSSIFEQSAGTGATSVYSHFVVLDGITTLSWMGIPLVDITRFLRAVRALCRKVSKSVTVYSNRALIASKRNASIVVRHHLTSLILDDLSRFLISQASVHVEVVPLLSGKSGSVSGEVSLQTLLISISIIHIYTGCYTLWPIGL